MTQWQMFKSKIKKDYLISSGIADFENNHSVPSFTSR